MGKSKLDFKFAVRDDQGDRPYQEDYGKVLGVRLGTGEDVPGGVLAVLCDGMGGHVSGEVASRSAAEAYLSAFGKGNGAISQRLGQSLDASNAALTSAIVENADLKGMGCTIVVAYVDSDGLRWVSVGDSALLLYRDGNLHRLNEDHSFGALLDKQAEAKVITRAEAENSPRRRTLRSALTGDPIALREVHSTPLKLKSGDWIIAASDGLETLSGNEIASIIRKSDASGPERLADHLVKAVLDRNAPNQDNITLIPISVSDPDDLHIQPTHWVQREDDDGGEEPDTVTQEIVGFKKRTSSGFVKAFGLMFLALLTIAGGVAGYLWHQGQLDWANLPGIIQDANRSGGAGGAEESDGAVAPSDAGLAAPKDAKSPDGDAASEPSAAEANTPDDPDGKAADVEPVDPVDATSDDTSDPVGGSESTPPSEDGAEADTEPDADADSEAQSKSDDAAGAGNGDASTEPSTPDL